MINNNGWERSWVMAGFCRSVYETANRPLRGLIRVGPFIVSFSYLNLDGHVVQGSDSQNNWYTYYILFIRSLFVEIWFFLVLLFFWPRFFRLINQPLTWQDWTDQWPRLARLQLLYSHFLGQILCALPLSIVAPSPDCQRWLGDCPGVHKKVDGKDMSFCVCKYVYIYIYYIYICIWTNT